MAVMDGTPRSTSSAAKDRKKRVPPRAPEAVMGEVGRVRQQGSATVPPERTGSPPPSSSCSLPSPGGGPATNGSPDVDRDSEGAGSAAYCCTIGHSQGPLSKLQIRPLLDLSAYPTATRPRYIDECATQMHRCQSNTACVNLPGSHRCDCLPGFIRVDEYSCTACPQLTSYWVTIDQPWP
ncbi:unnamed protein product [Arctogadus glacialis]